MIRLEPGKKGPEKPDSALRKFVYFCWCCICSFIFFYWLMTDVIPAHMGF